MINDYQFNKDTGEITTYLGNETHIVIPQYINGIEVQAIGQNAFIFSQIESVVFHHSIIKIGAFAFAYNRIKQIEIPISVTFIGKGAFNFN